MIKTDNEFLGTLIKCANDNHDCDVSDIIEQSGLSDIDCIPFLKSLEEKRIIRTVDTCTFHLNPGAYSYYISPTKKFFRCFGKLSWSLLKYVISYVLGIVSGLIVAYATHLFGWLN